VVWREVHGVHKLDQNMSTGEELPEEAQREMVLLKLKVQMVLS